MKNDKSLVEQKSMLAKLMAAENISVEHKKVPTAAFDIKNRVLYLPILKWKPGSSVYDLFCSHEVGHALWTPEAGWHSSASKKGKGYKSFLNVVEDARIEKKIKRKFGGARKCMSDGYKKLMDNDFFGLRKMGVDVNELNLIDRINLYTKAGGDYGITFSEEEREWIEKVERTETFEDVVNVTNALYEYCKENESETDNSYSDFSFGDGEFDESDEYEESEGMDDFEMEDFDMDMAGNESAESDSEEDGSSGSGSEGEESDDSNSGMNSFEKEVKDAMDKMKEENESKSDDSTEEKDKSSNTSNGLEGGIGNPFSDNRNSFEPTSFTDENFRENEADVANMSDDVSIPVYVTVPKINTDVLVIDYKKTLKEISEYYQEQSGSTEHGMKLLKNFKNSNEKMISYMVKEFEMKKAADIHRRAYTSKKGTLDMNKIHSYKYSENLFQQITNLPEGKNHGMVMFIDWSGSMHGMIKDTIEQLINLTMFCSKVQIPFEVYAFVDHYRDWDSEYNSRYHGDYERYSGVSSAGKRFATYKKGDLMLNGCFRLLNFFSSRMRRTELNDAYKNLLLMGESLDCRYSRYWDRQHDYFGVPSNYSLGGTPLDDAIITAKTIIAEFKTKTKAQIVNAVFLTDGQSSPLNTYYDPTQKCGYNNFGWRDTFHIDDHATRTRVSSVERHRRGGTTDTYLKFLKETLEINVLGFFLCPSGRGNSLKYILDHYPTQEELSKFRKDKFLIDTESAYDELYIINSKGLEIDEVDYIEKVEVGSSKAELRKALRKNTKNKLQNRVLLNAFIKKVA
ncbi:MAG: hypothetical protein QGH83_15865 [Candidatus Pacebacteria bacterium]|nr:hypothetical protein [Candidatus Paceibacterota bacterium]